MKIRELTIKNFKNIKELHMDNIPDLVVLAGTNGCGKTSIFDAIRVFKAVIGPYHANVLSSIQTRKFRNEIKNMVNLNAESAEITMGVEPSDSEKKYLLTFYPNLDEILSQNQGLLKATINIPRRGRLRPIPTSTPLAELLKHYDPSDELGTFEYIPANRNIQFGDPGTISLNATSLDQEKLERMGNVNEKYTKFKYYLIMMVLYDKLNVSDYASKFFPDLKRIFNDFLPSKEFLGLEIDKALKWHFPVKTPYGNHDIDFLSSGEKEILMMYTNILKMKLTGSVILIDEPDLHLNATLERKIITSFQRIVDEGNQVWMATHSLEIIGTVKLENLYKMYSDIPQGSNNQLELCSTQMDRIEVFEEVGASKGIQLISEKIVFVEGKTDKEMLRTLFDEYSHKISFVRTKGVRPLMSLSQSVVAILDQVSQHEPFFMIRDRDLLSEDKVEEITTKYMGKVIIWESRTIDNYLLEPKILKNVLNRLGITNFSNEEEISISLKEIVNDCKPELINEMIKNEIQNKITKLVFGLPSVNSEDDLLPLFLEVGAKKRCRLNDQISEASLKTIFTEKKSYVDSVWGTDSLKICNGKMVLEKFIEKHIIPYGLKINVNALRRLIISEMKSTNAIPKEIEDVILKQILGINAHDSD